MNKYFWQTLYKHWLAGKQRLQFIGFIKVSRTSDVILAITDHKRNGDSESTGTTRDRVEEIVDTINDGNEDQTMIAEFVKSYTNAKCAIKLKTGDLTLMPSLSNIKIKDIVLKNECIEVATCTDHAQLNSGADIQAFVGENILNALLEKFSAATDQARVKVTALHIDLSKTDSAFSFDVNNNGSNGSCTFKTDSHVPDLNKVELDVKEPETTGGFSADELITAVIDVINEKIRNERSAVRGQKLEFTYEDGKIKFEANLDDVIPLKVRPGVFKIDTSDTYITINAQTL